MKKKNIYDNNNPLFFLFTCVKEGRPYIEKLFESLLHQTKINFVHYIYEDGSLDPIEDLVEKYKEQVLKLEHPYKVIYERNPVNIGLNMATKHCIDQCFLPYFIWIDCDNWVNNNFFKEMEILALNNKKAIVLRSTVVESNKNRIYDKKALKAHMMKKQLKNFLYNYYYYYSFFAVNYSLYKKENPQNFLFEKREYFNDLQILFTCLNNNSDVGFSSNAIGYFLYHEDNESCLFKIDRKTNFSDFKATAVFLKSNIQYYLDAVFEASNLFDEMEKIKNLSPKTARKRFRQINYIYNKNNVPKHLRFKYGNKITWFIRLFIVPFLHR